MTQGEDTAVSDSGKGPGWMRVVSVVVETYCLLGVAALIHVATGSKS